MIKNRRLVVVLLVLALCLSVVYLLKEKRDEDARQEAEKFYRKESTR